MNEGRIKGRIFIVDFFRNADPSIRLEATLFTLEPDSIPVADVFEELVALVFRMDNKVDPFWLKLTVA